MTERAADDFAMIRRRINELRRKEKPAEAAPEPGAEYLPGDAVSDVDERYRARAEGAPPPWVPTIV